MRRRSFLKDDSGSTAIEYGLIAALIAVTMIGGMLLVKAKLAETFAVVAGAVAED